MSRKRVPLNQNECTADFGIGVPFEQNLHIGLFFGNDRIDIALFCGWTKYNNSKYLKLAPVDKDKEGKAMEYQ